MRTLVLAALVVVALVASSRTTEHALAKGEPIAVAPDAGPANTAVRLSSDFWQPGTKVEVYVGAAATYVEPSSYAGPIAQTSSDAGGRWSLALNVGDLPGFTVPHAPSFVVFKAISPDAEGATTGASVGLAFFALTVDGRHPDGAGGIDLTIVRAPATAWLDWEPAGSDTFYISHVGPFGTELRDYPLGHLTNGDWDIVVPSIPLLVPRAAIGGRAITVQATLCASPSIPCDPRPGPLRVVRASIRDGEITAVTITLGVPPDATTMPASGTGSADTSRVGFVEIGVELFAAGAAVAAFGAAMRASRRHGRLGCVSKRTVVV